jgi:pyruvate dehydrogenase E1 component alpha subunit
VLAVYEAVREARDYVVKTGPMLIVQNTYRTSGHSKSDNDLYRSQAEIDAWRARCPILRFKNYLLENEIYTEEAIDAMDEETTAIIAAAVAFGKDSPEPSLDDILTDVYA